MIRRRRCCVRCQARFTTREILEAQVLDLRKTKNMLGAIEGAISGMEEALALGRSKIDAIKGAQ